MKDIERQWKLKPNHKFPRCFFGMLSIYRLLLGAFRGKNEDCRIGALLPIFASSVAQSRWFDEHLMAGGPCKAFCNGARNYADTIFRRLTLLIWLALLHPFFDFRDEPVQLWLVILIQNPPCFTRFALAARAEDGRALSCHIAPSLQCRVPLPPFLGGWVNDLYLACLAGEKGHTA